MITGGIVETDFYKAIKETELAKQVNGEVYRAEYRPRDSKKEDIIVILTTLTAGQIQDGVVTVLIYVPDIDFDGTGELRRNNARIQDLEICCLTALKELRIELKDYNDIALQQGIQSFEDTNEQHFISMRISFRLLNKNF